jgi:hypothetical protein
MVGTILGLEKGGEKAMEAILSDFLVLQSWASASVVALLVLAIGLLLTWNRGVPESMGLCAPP